MKTYNYLIIATFLILFSNLNYAQKSNGDLGYDIKHISEYIITDLSKYQNDYSYWLDSLYTYTFNYCNHDTEETLFLLTFALLPYREMPLSLPFTKSRLVIPLPSTNDKIFKLKLEHMPNKIYFESPDSKFGDKDKFSHFFGNAFLSNSIPLINISDFMGLFVEHFEALFKVEGGLSNEDLIINKIGSWFGIMLNNDKTVKPSHAFLLYNILMYYRTDL